MPTLIQPAVADLQIDTRNSRLPKEQQSQPAAMLALATEEWKSVIRLAEDIVDNGVDPLALSGVIRAPEPGQYIAVEGNRRLLALKALENPTVVAAALDAPQRKRLDRLSDQYLKRPIANLTCMLFEPDEEAELDHWVELRHTGANEGVGLVEWGPEEKDRHLSRRHGRPRSPEGQALDFLRRMGDLDEGGKQLKIATNLHRLLISPAVRKRLGISLSEGRLYSEYPAEEVAKGINRIVGDLRSREIRVKHIYHAGDRVDYAARLPEEDLPDPSSRLPSPIALDDLSPSSGAAAKKSPGKQTKKKGASDKKRTTLIPRSAQIQIDQRRLDQMYRELKTLLVDDFPNAAAVLLRVFIELSVDTYIERSSTLRKSVKLDQPLAKRIKAVAADLLTADKISPQLKTAMDHVGSTGKALALSTVTCNQWVHNQYAFPDAAQLKLTWDEVEPFLAAIWS